MNLIPYGIGLAGSLIGGKLAGKKTPQEEAALKTQQDNMTAAQGYAKTASGAGTDLVNLAGRSFSPVIDYWSRILSGDRGSMTSLMNPEISRIGEGYKTAAATSTSLMPRGGPRADVLAEMPFNQQRDVSTLLQGARPQAAVALGQTGAAAGGVGGNLISNSINALNSSTSAGRSMLDYTAQRRDADRATGTGLGRTIFDLLKNFKMGGGSKGKGTSTGGILGEFP